jgi:hypothetical protein
MTIALSPPGTTPELGLDFGMAPKARVRLSLADDLAAFCEFGEATRKLPITYTEGGDQVHEVPAFVNEYWTARQRQASSLHEVSYRACFKPLGDVNDETRATLSRVGHNPLLLTGAAQSTPQIPSGSVSLVVTSPPFLDIVNYATDNWLRCWFLGIEPTNVKLTVPRKLEDWRVAMTAVFRELQRVLKPGGHVAFEVGEVHAGKTKLEETVLPCGVAAGLEPLLVLINDQQFTKTANCWGVDNMSKGTNTNRIVVFRKG